MSAGIKITGKGAVLETVRIEGFDVGVEAINASFKARGVRFNNVPKPWHIRDSEANLEGTRIRNDPKVGKPGSAASSVGWRRTGPRVPARCPRCLSVFPSVNYDFGTSRFFSRDNEEVCPVCKFEHAKVADGLFNLTEKAVEILVASDVTLEMLQQIQDIARDSLESETNLAQVTTKIETVSPKLADVVRDANNEGRPALAFLLTVIGLVVAALSLKVSYDALELSREQTRLARESLELQKSAPSPEEILKSVIQQVAPYTFSPDDPPAADPQLEP